ncbi:MAG: 30S ribosomal protein S12 methylthiotransferase RimO [bacterium]
MKVGLISLGCPKNLVDSEAILGLLQDSFEITNREEEADVLIVNTCGFIDKATEESISTIRELVPLKKKRCRALIVTGCLTQRYKGELKRVIPEIDATLGTDFRRIKEVCLKALDGSPPDVRIDPPSYLYDGETPRVQATPHYTAYIKIAEGCNNRCSFCVIPKLRGPQRSRPIESILKEARHLAERGVRELNIISQDTTRYGLDLYGKPRLADLLRELTRLEVDWIRVMYMHPTHLNDDLLEVMASEEKICEYIDLPIQHVNRSILRRMRRGGDAENIMKMIQKIRREIPDVAIRTAFIVGFPGEGEGEFRELLDFVSEAKFDRLGAFTYSNEDLAESSSFPNQVPEEEKMARLDRLMRLQMDISLERNRRMIGREMDVLIEGEADERTWVGRSRHDAPSIDGAVYVCGAKRGHRPSPGDIVRARITGCNTYDLKGKIRERS